MLEFASMGFFHAFRSFCLQFILFVSTGLQSSRSAASEFWMDPQEPYLNARYRTLGKLVRIRNILAITKLDWGIYGRHGALRKN